VRPWLGAMGTWQVMEMAGLRSLAAWVATTIDSATSAAGMNE